MLINKFTIYLLAKGNEIAPTSKRNQESQNFIATIYERVQSNQLNKSHCSINSQHLDNLISLSFAKLAVQVVPFGKHETEEQALRAFNFKPLLVIGYREGKKSKLKTQKSKLILTFDF